MSERSNRNSDKFARAIRRQESQDWFQRQKTDLDRRAQTIAEQMRGVFSGYMMTPAAVLAGEVVAARHQHGEAFYNEAYRTAAFAFQGGNGDPWQMYTGAVVSSKGKRREGGRFSPEARNMFVLIALLILAAMLLGACAPPAGATFETETPTAAASTIATATEMPDDVPTMAATEAPATPEPTVEMDPTQEQQAPTNWERPPVDNLGNYNYDCTITGVSNEIIEMMPGIDGAGFLICDGYKIPTYIHDRNTNTLYAWGLNPIHDPQGLDKLGERGVGRFMRIFGFGGTYADAAKLNGVRLSLSIGLPNASNGAVFDVQNMGQFADEYYGSQAAIDAWATTGIPPEGNGILYPISLGVIK